MSALLLGAGLVFAQSEQSEVKQFRATAKEAAKFGACDCPLL
jgi:hypothetical protein